MNPSTKQLYLFLAACGGNWRNTIHIACREERDSPGYLLAADRDGQPVILGVHQFYLLWQCPTARGHPLRQLCAANMETAP